MPRRYIFLILILFMFILPLSYAKSFYITDANVTYTIYPQGYVHVVEDVEYFLDCDYEHFHELYRELPRGLSFDNASGYCLGDTCTFRYDPPEYSVSGDPELILELSDGCGDVTAHFEYNVYTLIKHKDNVQFYYKVWGDKSPQVRRLSVNIILPRSVNDTIYFIHPWDSKVAIVNTTNGVIFHSSNYPSQTFLEINLLMPLKWFDNSSSYITGTSSKEEIIRNENIDKVLFYIGKIIEMIIEIIVLILLFLAIFFPWVFGVYCYYKYGRELAQNELGYSALYEREPPSDHSPAEVASIVSGDYDFEHSLQATIISLAAKGWIDIKKKGDDYVIVFNDAGKRIKDFEKDVYDELKKHATLSSKTNKEKVLSINHFKKRVAPTRTFYYWHKSWVSKLKKNISIDQYIDSTGYDKFLFVVGSFVIMFSIIFIVMMFIMPWFEGLIDISNVFIILFFIILSSMLALGVFTYKKIWLSRWNREGRLLFFKWNNFKKFLSDYSLLKEHPPQTVKIWELYLAYAVGLNVADETIRAMKKVDPSFVEQTDDFNSFVYIYSYSVFTPSYTPPSRSSYSSSGGWSGGFSGSGGGFGGGGFGAR